LLLLLGIFVSLIETTRYSGFELLLHLQGGWEVRWHIVSLLCVCIKKIEWFKRKRFESWNWERVKENIVEREGCTNGCVLLFIAFEWVLLPLGTFGGAKTFNIDRPKSYHIYDVWDIIYVFFVFNYNLVNDESYKTYHIVYMIYDV
jgi:hypothetical protein